MRLVATFEDGEELYRAVCDRGLEEIVAKRARDPYRPGERGRMKIKNRERRASLRSATAPAGAPPTPDVRSGERMLAQPSLYGVALASLTAPAFFGCRHRHRVSIA